MPVEESARVVAEFLLDNDLMEENVTFSERKNGFRINLDLSTIPKETATACKSCCTDMSTTVNKSKLRVRFLSSKLLEEATVQKMKDELETYDLWIAQYLVDSKENLIEYAEQFFDYAGYESGDEISLLLGYELKPLKAMFTGSEIVTSAGSRTQAIEGSGEDTLSPLSISPVASSSTSKQKVNATEKTDTAPGKSKTGGKSKANDR